MAEVKDMEFERNRNPITLSRFLLEERQLRAPSSTGDFVMLLQSIQLAVKVISAATHKAGLANLYGLAGGINESGDDQKKLDVLANDVFINTIKFSGQVYVMGSEEDESAIVLEESSGGYAVVFDPLDGSSNIDCNCGVGSIWGIYHKNPSQKSHDSSSIKDLLRPGSELVAAGYAIYGSATMIVLSIGYGVHGFTLDPSIGDFLLTHRNMKVPVKGKYYSINEGNRLKWDDSTKTYIDLQHKRGLSGRYIGSMVLDVHRTLLYGGVFSYPRDKKNPNGKLRLLYEGNPMAFLIEQAGGVAVTGNVIVPIDTNTLVSDGEVREKATKAGYKKKFLTKNGRTGYAERILDIQPTSLHERCPIWLGSAAMLEEVL